MEKFSLGFKMKMLKGYCAKIYGRSGMTVKHGIHLAGGVSIIELSHNLDRSFRYLCSSEFPHSGAARTFSTECAVKVQ